MTTNYTIKKSKQSKIKSSILIDLIRSKLVNEIMQEIDYILTKNKIRSTAKKLIPVWIMNQSLDKDFIIPYNASNNDQITKDIKYFVTMNGSTDISETVNKILNELDLVNRFNKTFDTLQSIISDNNKIINILLDITVIINNNLTYLKLEPINHSILQEYIEFTKQITIPTNVYKKLQKRFTSKDINLFHNLVYSICVRYNTLNSGNMQLANEPKLYKLLKDKCDTNFELFASALNCYYDNFCSLFPDIEKHFGSVGNFNEIKLLEGEYVSNPPFDNAIIENMCNKLISYIKTANKNNKYLSIFITIPYWKDTLEYGEYKSKKILEKSTFITFSLVLPKEKTKFYDHYLNRYITPGEMWYVVIQSEVAKKESKLVDTLTKYFD